MPKAERRLKDQSIQVVTDEKTGDKIEIFLDRNKLVFYAKYQGDEFTHKEADPVIAWADERLKEGRKVVWYPVIEVTCRNKITEDKRWPGSVDLVYHVTRWYLGVTAGRNLKHVRWDAYTSYMADREHQSKTFWPRRRELDPAWEPEPERTEEQVRLSSMSNAGAKIKLTRDKQPILPVEQEKERTYSDRDSYVIYLAYSDELWAGINNMIEAIRVLGGRLDSMIRSGEGQERIGEIGSNLIKMLPAPAPKEGDDATH